MANHKGSTTAQKNEARRLSQELDMITSQFMLRRFQKDVLKTILPPRHEVLLFCRPSREQCIMYQKLTNNGDISPTSGVSSSADALMILTDLRKLCSHPNLVYNREENPRNSVKENIELPGKLLVLDHLLQSIRQQFPTDKVVVISNFTSALTVIDQSIISKHQGWSSVRLDGSISQSARQPIVDSFNRTNPKQSFIFLLSSKAGGCGLNLIGGRYLNPSLFLSCRSNELLISVDPF